ncbi:ABC transporter permease [Quadrisphaera sp. DSM 44207]|uniref:ABC transporter permease n=1 Tax=Quadrisphaera sp. DSM 44207 TaxID=1881057 RepID=UPI00088BCBA3|nr:FtsX-like permease family protein [Quadrisphaera sp. DSM 44207]SDQ78097.1 putative ABC transport system permease protein [Quadrisphaera sp. DSM 44207]
MRVALAGVRRHLVRFLLTATSVLLGVSFVAGTFVLTDTLDRSFTDLFASSAEGTDVVVRGLAGAEGPQGDALRSQLPLDLAERLRAVDGVAVAEPALSGSAVLVGADGTAVRQGGAPALGTGYVEDDPVLELVDGRSPTAPGEIAVEEATLARSGLDVGDRTRVLAGADVRDAQVVGVVRGAALAGSTLVVFDPASAREYYAPEGTVASFAVRAEDGVGQVELRDRVAQVLPAGAEAITGEEQVREDTENIREALGFISTFLLVFAGISLVVGCFIIVNTFSMLVAQRTRELALLRAIGASGRQVVGSVLAEALAVGAVGGVLGVGAGIGLAAVLAAVLGAVGLELTGGLVVAPRTLLVGVLTGVVVTVLAAVAPALRAARIAPVAAMRDDVALPERSLRTRALLGALLVVAAGVGLWLSLGALGTTSGVGVALSALALFLGVAVAAPLLARPVLRVLAAPFTALRPVGRLARENALRNPRRTATTAGALMVGLALVTGVTVLTASTRSSTAAIVEESVRADLVLNAGFTGFPPAASDAVRGVDGVASVAELAFVPSDLGSGFTVAADASDLAQNVVVDVEEGSLDALDDGDVLVSSSYAEEEGLAVGDELTATVGTLTGQQLRVGGVFADNQAVGSSVVLPASLVEQAVPEPQRLDLFGYVTLEDGADAAAVREAVTDAVAPYVVLSVQDREEYVSAQADQTQQLLITIYVLLALSVVIAVLGIINTLALSVVERTREIGLLRAVGMRRRQLAATITVESVLTALFGAVLGTVLGLVLGVALQRALVEQGLTELSVPGASLAGVFVVAAVIGVVAAVLPAVRAVRLDVLRAIATE